MDFYIKQNDSAADLIITPKNENGETVDLSGVKSCVFNMKNAQTQEVVINRKPAVVDKVNNTLKYDFVVEDTATSGKFQGEFEMLMNSGDIRTIPTNDFITIIITPDIA